MLWRQRSWRDGPIVVLTGEDLTIKQVMSVARDRARVEVAPVAVARMREARDVVERAMARGDVLYGLTTGLGPLARYRLGADAMERYLTPMLVGHAATHGERLPTEVVRAMMVTRANGMARGGVGCG